MKDTELAWCAGIIDGEGCISISIDTRSQGCYNVHLGLRMTDENTVREFLKFVGGGTVVRKEIRINPKHKDTFEIEWYSQNAVRVIKLLQPYLITKKRQAELAIEFGERCITGYIGSKSIPDDLRMLRMVIYSEMKELNRKGK